MVSIYDKKATNSRDMVEWQINLLKISLQVDS